MTGAPNPQKPIEVFISYSRRDEELLNELKNHITTLKHRGIITHWHDRNISAGAEWAAEIDEHLNKAEMILLLISSDFLASDYCTSIEMRRAMERHDAGEAIVIPVIMRPVDWEGVKFGKLNTLPRDGRPVTSWTDRDEAFENVAKGIRAAIDELQKQQQLATLYNRAQLHMQAQAWTEALAILSQIKRLQPGYGNTEQLLQWAELECKVMQLYVQAQQHKHVGEWPQARKVLSEIKRSYPNYRDTEYLLQWAELECKVADLYAQGRQHIQTQAWMEARNAFAEVKHAYPNYLDTEQLLQWAELECKMAGLYAQSQQHMQAREWEQALNVLSEIKRSYPNYRDTEQLLEQIELEQKAAELYVQSQQHMNVQDWTQALKVLSDIKRLHPGYRDTEQLWQKALECKVVELYAQSQQHIQAQAWSQARQSLSELEQLHPGYRNVQELLGVVNDKLEVITQYRLKVTLVGCGILIMLLMVLLPPGTGRNTFPLITAPKTQIPVASTPTDVTANPPAASAPAATVPTVSVPATSDPEEQVLQLFIRFWEIRQQAREHSESTLLPQVLTGKRLAAENELINNNKDTHVYLENISLARPKMLRLRFDGQKAYAEFELHEDIVFYVIQCGNVPDDALDNACLKALGREPTTKRNCRYLAKFDLVYVDERWKIEDIKVGEAAPGSCPP